MVIANIVGTRPNIIKSSLFTKQLIERGHEVINIHAGQHYDKNMSDVFYEELEIVKPTCTIDIDKKNQFTQLSSMIDKLSQILESAQDKIELAFVYGDCNCTLAASLACAYLNIPIAHIEAGVRSGNMEMPEEVNRKLVDNVAKYRFCPSQNGIDNLKNEGIVDNCYDVGDIQKDVYHANNIKILEKSGILEKLGVERYSYYVCTFHRGYNVDEKEPLEKIVTKLNGLDKKVVFPLHPRTRKHIENFGLTLNTNIIVIEPVSYISMMALINGAAKVITDSGGLQKESAYVNTPCITVRSETEWKETIDNKYNKLCTVDNFDAEVKVKLISNGEPLYGDGETGQKIIKILEL